MREVKKKSLAVRAMCEILVVYYWAGFNLFHAHPLHMPIKLYDDNTEDDHTDNNSRVTVTLTHQV